MITPTAQTQPKAKISKIEILKNPDILGEAYGMEWKVIITRQDGSTEETYRDTIPHEGDSRMIGFYYSGFKAGAMVWKPKTNNRPIPRK